MPEPRLFTIVRRGDETGVSGTGRVLDGVVLHNGEVVVIWRSDVNQNTPDRPGYTSICIYPCWDAFKRVHLDAHPQNRAEIIFGEGEHLEGLLRASGFERDGSLSRPGLDERAVREGE